MAELSTIARPYAVAAYKLGKEKRHWQNGLKCWRWLLRLLPMTK